MKIVGIIPVKKNSDRVKGKNLRKFSNTNLFELKLKQLAKTKSFDDLSCNGISPCDGEASVTVTGQQGSNTLYQWFDGTSNTPMAGATNNTISGLCTGNYYVEITPQ